MREATMNKREDQELLAAYIKMLQDRMNRKEGWLEFISPHDSAVRNVQYYSLTVQTGDGKNFTMDEMGNGEGGIETENERLEDLDKMRANMLYGIFTRMMVTEHIKNQLIERMMVSMGYDVLVGTSPEEIKEQVDEMLKEQDKKKDVSKKH